MIHTITYFSSIRHLPTSLWKTILRQNRIYSSYCVVVYICITVGDLIVNRGWFWIHSPFPSSKTRQDKHICSLHAKMWKTNQFYFKRYNKNQNKFSKPLVFFNKIKKKVLPPKKIKQTNKNKKNPPRQKKSSILNFCQNLFMS